MKLSLTILVWFLSITAGIAQIDAREIIRRSVARYAAMEGFHIRVEIESSTAIEADTSMYAFYVLGQHSADTVLYTDSSARPKMLAYQHRHYYFEDSARSWSLAPRKWLKDFNEEPYGNLPFIRKDFFNDAITHHLSVDSSNNLFNITWTGAFGDLHEVDFDGHTFALVRMKTTKFREVGNSVSFKETRITEKAFDQKQVHDQLKPMLDLVLDPARDAAKIPKPRSIKPTQLDLGFMRSGNQDLKNGDPTTLKHERILIDFFYQGCYPCVLAYPRLEELSRDTTAGLGMFGVDVNLDDTLHAERYFRKYNIAYPVLMGGDAQAMIKSLELKAYPTFMIVDQQGNILETLKGFTKHSLNKLIRKYSHK